MVLVAELRGWNLSAFLFALQRIIRILSDIFTVIVNRIRKTDMLKILITGGSGFIGRNVIDFLARKNEKYIVYAPSSKELDCLNEKQVTQYLEKHHFDYVLHFAVYAKRPDNQKDDTKKVEYNLRIFLNFAQNINLYGKMFYLGSGAEYDKRFPIVKVREETVGATIPVDTYGLMKYTIGQLIESSQNIYNFRLFGIFGKYEYYPLKFISNVCCKAIKNLPLSISQDVCFDYLWIEDFCRMLECFLQNEPKYHTYNLVSGKTVRLSEICQIVLKVSKKDLPVLICREGMGNEYTARCDRFLDEFPQFEYTPLEKSIEKLYDWYENSADIDIYELLYCAK